MKEILVYADWAALPQISKMGNLRTEISKGEEIFSFRYTDSWLANGFEQELDPDLKMFAGPQYLQDHKPNFELILDSSPDRWGRMLMKRREAIKSRVKGERPLHMRESDYLLGVNDETRLGGLRFKLSETDPFLECDEEMKTPPISCIRELEHASTRIEDDDLAG